MIGIYVEQPLSISKRMTVPYTFRYKLELNSPYQLGIPSDNYFTTTMSNYMAIMSIDQFLLQKMLYHQSSKQFANFMSISYRVKPEYFTPSL